MTTVLTVDDALGDQRLAGACLKSLGFNVIYAENGREAVTVIERDSPDIVLTDLQMPEMDGLELVDFIRQSYPALPVILMTGFGSEETAAQALKAGACSYVPKKNLNRELGEALEVAKATLEAAKQRDEVLHLLQESVTRFVLGFDPGERAALIGYLQDALLRLNFCDENGLLQISTALTEALANAVDHGNLELDSALRELPGNEYRELRRQRSQLPPYRDRKVRVTARLAPSEVSYTIHDEGGGFDHTSLPDPTEPENLLKASGRGVMLMRTFMDDVQYNDSGNQITIIKRRCV